MDKPTEEKSIPLTFINASRISVTDAKTDVHGSKGDLAVLLAIIIKDLVTMGLDKSLIYRAVNIGLKKAKKEKRGSKK